MYDTDGKIIYVNPATEKTFGCHAGELNGSPVLTYVAPELRDSMALNLAAHEEGRESPEYETVIITRDGTRRTVIVKGTRIRYHESPAMLLLLNDITERKKAEEALRESESRLNGIIRVAPVGIGVAVDRIIQSFNERFCQITGYTSEEIVGHSARILYPAEEDYDHVGRVVYSKIPSEGRASTETRWRKTGPLLMLSFRRLLSIPRTFR